jgi:hypothetical protein
VTFALLVLVGAAAVVWLVARPPRERPASRDFDPWHARYLRELADAVKRGPP